MASGSGRKSLAALTAARRGGGVTGDRWVLSGGAERGRGAGDGHPGRAEGAVMTGGRTMQRLWPTPKPGDPGVTAPPQKKRLSAPFPPPTSQVDGHAARHQCVPHLLGHIVLTDRVLHGCGRRAAAGGRLGGRRCDSKAGRQGSGQGGRPTHTELVASEHLLLVVVGISRHLHVGVALAKGMHLQARQPGARRGRPPPASAPRPGMRPPACCHDTAARHPPLTPPPPPGIWPSLAGPQGPMPAPAARPRPARTSSWRASGASKAMMLCCMSKP